MAAADTPDLKTTFPKFAAKDGKMKGKDCTKWCKDAGVLTTKKCSGNNLDIAFSKHCDKAKKTLDMKQLQSVIAEISKAYAEDKKLSQPDAEKQITEKMAGASPKTHGATKQSTTGGVAKMTDSSKYTGAHKNRFDESGKGKGKGGREDTEEKTGYVGNYKGQDTYEKGKK